MKTCFKFLLVLMTISIHSAFSQCRPVYTPVPMQAPTLKNYYANEAILSNGNSLPCYSLTAKDSLQLQDTIIYVVWEDSAWVTLPKVFLKSSGAWDLMKWNNHYYISGRWSAYENYTAPSRKLFTLLKLNNGIWDSVPSCVLADSGIYFRYTWTNQGLYRSYSWDSAIGNGKYHFPGLIQQFDSNTNQFITIHRTHSTISANVLGGTNRLLIAGIDEIDQIPSAGFAYLDSGKLYRNTNTAFFPFYNYFIDPSTDYVYLILVSNSVRIKEFGKNSLLRDFTAGPLPMNNALVNGVAVQNGIIVYANVDDNVLGNRYINILCPNETNWKTIVQSGFGEFGNLRNYRGGHYIYQRHLHTLSQLGNGSALSGRAYIDLDSNCQYDSTIDVPLKQQLIHATTNNYSSGGLTDHNGRYELFTIEDTFKIKGPLSNSSCMTDTVIMPKNGVRTKDIFLRKPGYYALRTRILHGNTVRWHDKVKYNLQVENIGEPSDSALIKFTIDPKVSFIDLGSIFVTDSINRVKASLNNLGYFDKRQLSVMVYIDSSLNKPDSILYHYLSGYLYDNDIDSSDNCDTLLQRVVYSYDPNHKSADKSEIKPFTKTRITYTIECQNEGNGDAIDVKITDLLSNQFDLESFRVIGASHPYTIDLNGNMLSIYFKDIHLKPKAQNDSLSKGFFKFSIVTKDNIPNNSKITNRASIFFDLNAPIVTNQVDIQVVDPLLSIRQQEFIQNKSLLVYPNPSFDKIFIQSDSQNSSTVKLYNLQGSLLLSGELTNGRLELNLSELNPGIYVILCGDLSCKIIKE